MWINISVVSLCTLSLYDFYAKRQPRKREYTNFMMTVLVTLCSVLKLCGRWEFCFAVVKTSVFT